MTEPRHLQIIVCGAGPAGDVTKLISLAHDRGWTTAVTATTAALDFVDAQQIQDLSGHPIRTGYQADGSAHGRVLPSVDALIIAPATFNTINKLALGIADSYALTSAAELIGRGVPTIIVPFVNAALAGRAPFSRSVELLRSEGVQVILGAEWSWPPHPPGSGHERRVAFPWIGAFETVAVQAGRARE